jgi:DNA processing protein
MINKLFFSHLPRSIAFHPSLNIFKENKNEISPSEIAQTLIANGKNPEQIWNNLNTALIQAQKTERFIRTHKINFVDFWSDFYPTRLRQIENPPWNLFYIGNLPDNFTPTLAVVGTRRPNKYGHELTTTFLSEIKTRPIQLISGLAYGIDAIAHQISCSKQIPNFAVFGCGLDQIYPPEHAALALQILEQNGGLISEYPPGMPPLAHHFPQRNRIISALADVVWVVQGTAKSGSYHTAQFAVAQEKILSTSPGDVFSELSEVPHKLLLNGAHLISKSMDLDVLLEISKVRTPTLL